MSSSLAACFIGAIVVSVVLAHSNQSTLSNSKLPQTNLSDASLSTTNTSDTNSTDVSLPIKPVENSSENLALNISEDPFKEFQDAIVVDENISESLDKILINAKSTSFKRLFHVLLHAGRMVTPKVKLRPDRLKLFFRNLVC